MNIELMQVSLQFNDKPVLQNISMSFVEGKITCLMGTSGKGKTTILNLIMGIMKQDSGELTGSQGLRIAAVFQEDRLIEHWDGIKNVKLVCAKDINDEYIQEEFNKLGIIDSIEKPVRDYSGGMRRRVAILRAILAPSDLLILDEPFRGFDTDLKYKVIDYIKENTKGRTVIVVTHEIEDVKRLEGNLITLE